MKHLLTLLLLITLTSCSVEQRIKDHSYTEKWHVEKGQRYQVYKTRGGKHYIIIVNKKLNLKRKYINKEISPEDIFIDSSNLSSLDSDNLEGALDVSTRGAAHYFFIFITLASFFIP